MKSSNDLLILGAGAVGLSLADVALRAGMGVTLLDPSGVARESSWAGAGMLTCRPRTLHDPLKPDYYDLAKWSVRLHAEWAQRLKEETGIDSGYRVCGALEVTRPHIKEAGDLSGELSDGIVSAPAETSDVSGGSENAVAKDDSAAWIERCVARGIAARWVSGDEARRLEPNICGEVLGAIEFPNEAQVRNPWFARALETSILNKGGTIIDDDGAAELLFEAEGTHVIGVRTTAGRTIFAKSVAVCTGAWTPLFAALAERVPAVKKMQPVRGELLCYQTGTNIATRLICERSHYFVPRGDGVILVGATHEKAGYDRSTTAAGRAALERFAHEMLPVLKDFKPIHHWAGLRPGMKGRHPLVGAVPGVRNLFLNAGHYRNGLTLAPACAEMLLDQILLRTERIDGLAWRP